MTRHLAFDCETTGVDVFSDRIVTLTLLLMEEDGSITANQTWLFDPECDIPAEATAVHGISSEYARTKGLHGATAAAAIDEIHDIIRVETAPERNTVLNVYNAPFDTTILESERRWRSPATKPLDFFDPATGQGICVYDPLVAWKGLDRYRPGRRTLTEAAKAYGVPVDETKTHASDYDCWLSGQVALKQLQDRSLKDLFPEEIHGWLRIQKAEQAASLQKYLREKNGEKDAVVPQAWPRLEGHRQHA